MVIGEKRYTVTEFEAYQAEHPDKRLELIDGRIVEKVTGEIHGIIALVIGAALRTWQKKHTITGHAGVEISHRAPEEEQSILIPDVSFRYTTDTATQQAATTLPDFAVEIKSPSNSFKELREKAEFYIVNGTRLVWLVYPAKQLVEVYQYDGTIDIFRDDDVLSGDDVLPDFQMTVRDVFDV